MYVCKYKMAMIYDYIDNSPLTRAVVLLNVLICDFNFENVTFACRRFRLVTLWVKGEICEIRTKKGFQIWKFKYKKYQ